jgi:hypothetical protein
MSWKKRGLDGIRLRDGWHHLMAQRCSEAFIKQSFIYKIIYLVLIILGRPTCNGSLYRIAWSYLYRSNLLFLVSLTLSLTLSAHSACSIITKWRSFIYLYGHIRPLPICRRHIYQGVIHLSRDLPRYQALAHYSGLAEANSED